MIAATGHAFLDAVANHIQAQGAATIGSNLFVHQMPADVSGTLLVDTMIMQSIDLNIAELHRVQFRSISRAASYAEGFAMSELIRDGVLAMRGVLDSIEVKMVRQLHSAVSFPLSTNTNSAEVIVSYAMTYGILT